MILLMHGYNHDGYIPLWQHYCYCNYHKRRFYRCARDGDGVMVKVCTYSESDNISNDKQNKINMKSLPHKLRAVIRGTEVQCPAESGDLYHL